MGKALGEAFGEFRPATTMVEGSGLILPESLVEIEFTSRLRNSRL